MNQYFYCFATKKNILFWYDKVRIIKNMKDWYIFKSDSWYI
jgi:hypothetical protein